MLGVLELARQKSKHVSGVCAVIQHEIGQLNASLTDVKTRLSETEEDIETMGMARGFLQELVNVVSTQNLARIEKLVNTALSNIFQDMSIEIKYGQKVKRGLNAYSILVLEDGEEGSIKSKGGGVMAVIALILRVMFNVVSKAHPIICMDESLGFLSDKYIQNCSSFLNELSKEFGIILVLISHKRAFAEFADHQFWVTKQNAETVITEGMAQGVWVT